MILRKKNSIRGALLAPYEGCCVGRVEEGGRCVSESPAPQDIWFRVPLSRSEFDMAFLQCGSGGGGALTELVLYML